MTRLTTTITGFIRLIVIAATGLTVYWILGMSILLYTGHVMQRPAIVTGLLVGPLCGCWIFPWLYRWWWR